MKVTLMMSLILLSFTSATLASKPISISTKASQLVETQLHKIKPDNDGMVLTRVIDLPKFKQGVYYRPFTAFGRGVVARGNRVEAIAFTSLSELQDYQPSKTRKDHINIQQGQYILLELYDGRYLALLPMASEKVYGQFFVAQEQLLLKTGNFGTATVSGKIPLLIWAYGDSPYSATQNAWQQVFQSGYVAAAPRAFKNYPEQPYGYLGWCSWEHYKKNISEDIISDAFHTLDQSTAPFRWVMVDDGYLDAKNSKLLSFGVNKKKFANGWKPIMELKNEEKIKWVGIWRNFGGYMGGVSNDHTMSDLKPYLSPTVKKGSLLPNGTKQASKAFYDKMVSDTKDNGFDFIKVDFHTRTFDLYKGTTDPVGAMRHNNEALENATHDMNLPLLNCIAQPNINSLQTKYSALTRSSPDYNQADKDKNKSNTYQSFANHLWMGQTVWGDLDMFHTHDARDVKPMTIARAIAGGPVYISDEPSKIKPEVLLPFAYEDGKLLRTSAPATLLPESFFIHPFRDEQVFRVIAPMQDGVVAIALFNFTESGKALTGNINTKDYPFAGELLQPNNGPWDLPKDGLLLFDPATQSVHNLTQSFTTNVANFDAKMVFLYPNVNGWAVIGRQDKYLPAAAVTLTSVTNSQISFTLEESGPLLIWSQNGAPKMAEHSFKSLGNGLYLANIPVAIGRTQLTVTR